MQQRITNIDASEILGIASFKGEQLVRAIRRQSRPRRWWGQPKTLYDLAHARSADAAELAAEHSATLAAAVAKERDRLQQLVRQQARPRRWPWQPQTVRDQVDERGVRLAATAATLSAQLAELAARRRDALADQLRRQSKPRRWWGQPKTARDQIDERGATLRVAVGNAASQVADTVGAARTALQEQVVAVPQAVSASMSAAADTLQGASEAARQRMSDTRDAAAQTLHTVGDAARQHVSDTTGAVSDAISGRVEATSDAIGEGVAAGQRRVRRGVRLVRWSFWSFVGGVIAGVLVAPRSGDETRRELGAAVQHLGDTFFPPDRV